MVKDEPLTKDRAKAQLNLCLTTEDALAVCHSGVVLTVPEKDRKTGDWKYRIEGYAADHEDVALIFALKPERKAVFITAFKRSHG